MKPCVAYLRVSTREQGKSGLGLDAQRESVRRHVTHTEGEILSEYVEIESGKRNNRPQLKLALDACRASGATLIVAKLDRLARNMAFTAALMEAGVDFVAADNPHANRLTIHIMAAMAEHEARLISDRTKAGLAQAKKRGTLLGSARPGKWEGKENMTRRIIGARRGGETRREEAVREHLALDSPALVVIASMPPGSTREDIRRELNARRCPYRGAYIEWTTTHVALIARRARRYKAKASRCSQGTEGSGT